MSLFADMLADFRAKQRWLWTALVPCAIVAVLANDWLGDWGLPITFGCGVIAGKFAPAARDGPA